MIEWINNASYQELLSKWRFAKSGSPWFQGDVGKHYSKVIFEKRDKLTNDEQTTASKNVGWDD